MVRFALMTLPAAEPRLVYGSRYLQWGIVSYQYCRILRIMSNLIYNLVFFKLNISQYIIWQSAFMQTLTQHEVEEIAKTFTQGYRRGFDNRSEERRVGKEC